MKKFSFILMMMVSLLALPFFLVGCNEEEGKELYKLTSLFFDVDDTSADETVERRASDDVYIDSYTIASAFSSVYNSDQKLSVLTSRTNGTDRLSSCPTYTVSNQPQLYFYGDPIRVALHIHINLRMTTKPNNYPTTPTSGWLNNPAQFGNVKYFVGTTQNTMVLQQDGSYTLTVQPFNAGQSGVTYYNNTYLTLRFEKVV